MPLADVTASPDLPPRRQQVLGLGVFNQVSALLVRVTQARICGTDVHIHVGEYSAEFPLILGHVFCDVTERVGARVTHFAPGQRVAADPNLDCGACTFCRRQRNNHCLHW